MDVDLICLQRTVRCSHMADDDDHPQTANQTRQIAADTLEELDAQDEKIGKADRDHRDVRLCK